METTLQRLSLIHISIYENIRFGRDVSKKEAMAAAQDAQAVEFIEEKGLDAMLAIRGMDLSGGQKQRLLITRALAKHPQILVLDDSSSALDYATDARLRRAIQENYGDLKMCIRDRFISVGWKFGFSTILVAHITFNIPYVILSVMPRLRQTNVSTYEAAMDLGATPLSAFFKVVLPDLAPVSYTHLDVYKRQL